MKRLFVYSIMACVALQVSAQSVLSFGGRGGFDFLLPQSEQQIHSTLGFAGAFDVGYTNYWAIKSADLGIHTGASVGCAKSGFELACEQQFTNYDYLNNEMLYTTSGTYKNAVKRVFVEIPLMVALRQKGFIAQLGVKVQFNVIGNTTQDLISPTIDAYYVPYAVHVVNEVITGVVPEDDLHKEYKGDAPSMSFLLASRLGYEASLKNNGRIGILAYVDYNVLGNRIGSIWKGKTNYDNKSNPQSVDPVINVSPIVDASNPVPSVTVNNVMESIVTSINPIQVGLAIYYAIEFGQNKPLPRRK